MADQPFNSDPNPEPAWDTPSGEPSPEPASTNTRAREWLAQLEAMIQNVAREAAPVAREVGAKAAELAAVAAVKAGPIAQRAAEATTEYGQRFAERAQSVAADWRHENEGAKASGDGADAPAPGELPEPPSEA